MIRLQPNIAPGKFIQYRPLVAAGRYSLTQERYANPIANWEQVAAKAFGPEGVATGRGNEEEPDRAATESQGDNAAMRTLSARGFAVGFSIVAVVGIVWG